MNIVRKTIEYAGLGDPSTPEEIGFEILGLRNAVRQAEELISRLEQAMALARLGLRQQEASDGGQGERAGDGGKASQSPEE